MCVHACACAHIFVGICLGVCTCLYTCRGKCQDLPVTPPSFFSCGSISPCAEACCFSKAGWLLNWNSTCLSLLTSQVLLDAGVSNPALVPAQQAHLPAEPYSTSPISAVFIPFSQGKLEHLEKLSCAPPVVPLAISQAPAKYLSAHWDVAAFRQTWF